MGKIKVHTFIITIVIIIIIITIITITIILMTTLSHSMCMILLGQTILPILRIC